MKITLIAIAAIVAASTATAQQVEQDSQSLSQSSSGVIMEGSDYNDNTPGLGGIAGNTTAPCSVHQGAGIVLPGFGFMLGSGRQDHGCMTQERSRFLHGLLSNTPRNQAEAEAKAAAIYAACAGDRQMRAALVAAGKCAVQ